MTNKHNVLIVGAGNIGAFYDNPKSENILTHAHAFKNHDAFNLLGFVDIDFLKAKKAAKLWKTSSYISIDEAFNKEKIDLVIIAANSEYHYKLLREVYKYNLKFIFVEKPITTKIEDSLKIIELYKKTTTKIGVNYKRSFLPAFNREKKNIKGGVYGRLVSIKGYYGKGILNNGSHLINLLLFLGFKINNFKALKIINDYLDEDPTITFSINDNIFIQAIDSNLFTCLELDLIFEKQRLIIKDLGGRIEKYRIEKDGNFIGYSFLKKYEDIETNLNKSLYYSAENINEYLNDLNSLNCSIIDGHNALDICIKIKDQIS